ncbi:MAG: hypothetical protein M3042_06625 [Actinomycetota bacterium]|nr:hypothetical protein [Actinomycetota bacterium]
MTRHPTDTVSLVAGLLFLGIVGVWALERSGVAPGAQAWILPALLIAVGAVGLLSVRPRRREAPGTDDDVPDADDVA